MHRDAKNLQSLEEIECDLCVIGAGAAGISIAREFINTKENVLLVESGDFEAKQETQLLYSGRAVGSVLEDDSQYLIQSRLRYFGGSTNHWAGWCRPLDDWDFETRPWVENSGWPVTSGELKPYYRRATSIVQIPQFPKPNAGPSPIAPLLADSSQIRTEYYHFSPPTRFGKMYRQEILDASNLTLLSNANAVNIKCNLAGTRVEKLDIQSLSGKRAKITAKKYVLAAGGIENARLLLASNSVHSQGIGNQHGVLGRYFIDHPHAYVGQLCITDPSLSREIYRFHLDQRHGKKTIGVFSTSYEAQQLHRLLNFSAELRTPVKRAMSRLTAEVIRQSESFDTFGKNTKQPLHVDLYVRAEQTPNSSSRVSLSDERDALGLLKCQLDWQLSRADQQSISKSVELLASEFGRALQGRARLFAPDGDFWPDARGGSHHIGTTRMHNSAKLGVTDCNAKVHGIENLHIAGSSLFPTSGFANPTLTIVALALRLADHLKKDLERHA